MLRFALVFLRFRSGSDLPAPAAHRCVPVMGRASRQPFGWQQAVAGFWLGVVVDISRRSDPFYAFACSNPRQEDERRRRC